MVVHLFLKALRIEYHVVADPLGSQVPSQRQSFDQIIVHLKTGWLEAHTFGFIGKKRKELSN